MKHDDLLYVAFFYFSLAASIFDRFFVIDRHKGPYGAVVGCTALVFLCGFEVVHPLVNVIVNTAIIRFSRKGWPGTISFSFTCCYLFYFRYFCSASPITNVFMMSTTLRMISVAMDSSAEESISDQKEIPYDKQSNDISSENIICYALHHVGLIAVPFYTYKTYCDYINLPFKHYPGEWHYRGIICIMDSHIIMFGRYLINYLYPLSYVSSEEFYNESNILFRLWYIYPVGFDFILRISNAFVLSNAACYVSGIGAYPDFTKPKCGHGPSKNLEKMLKIPRESLYQYRYSHKTIQMANVRKVHSSLEFKESIKYWNQTIQFWMYKYVYRMVPYNVLKKPATMLFSSFWHGLQIGNFTSLFFSSLILYIEERWEIILKRRELPAIANYIRLILKLHILYNLIFTFVCQEWSLIVRYQTSVYWNYIILLILFLLGSVLLARR